MPRVNMCSVSNGRRNVTERGLQKRVTFVSCPNTMKTTCFVQRQCSQAHFRRGGEAGLFGGHAARGGG